MTSRSMTPNEDLLPAVDIVRASDDATIAQALGVSVADYRSRAPLGMETADPLVIGGSMAAAHFVGEKLIDCRALRTNKSPSMATGIHSGANPRLLEIGPPEEAGAALRYRFKRERLARNLVADQENDHATDLYQRIISWLRPIKERIAPTVPVELTDRLWAYEEGHWSKVKGATYIGEDGLSVIVLATPFAEDLAPVLYREMVVALRADGRISNEEWLTLRTWVASRMAPRANLPMRH